MGQEILAARLAGLNEEDAITRVMKFMKNDTLGREEGGRMKQVIGWDLDDVVREQTEYVCRLTPIKEHAEAIADGSFTPELLKSVDPELWPAIVHGPVMDSAGSHTNIFKRIGRGWGKAILEMPTNKLIRQPFFKANYVRIYDFLKDQAETSGKFVDGALPEELDNAFQAEARRFAIARTQQIMFDFTRSGRLAEMAWFVSPFLQPFTEMFVAWPRIIKQNPAMLGYLNRLGQAAHESRLFQEKDGELVIPASNYLAAAPLMAALTGANLTGGAGGGWALTWNPAAVNMFMNSAYPINIGGVDMALPTPSFSPPAQWALQQFLDLAPIDQQIKTKTMNWLTEYGDVSATRPQDWALPTWLRHALTGAVPSWFEETTDRNLMHFRAIQQAQGQEIDNDAAHWQAQQFSLVRALYALFMPASPRIEWPDQASEDEFTALYEADPKTAYEKFVGVWNPDTNKFEGGSHPGATLTAAAISAWDDSKNPFPMPANELADRILKSSGGKQFVKDFPEFAFFIIPKEIRDGEMDLGIWNKQVADGQRKILTPDEQWDTAESKAAYTAAFAVRDQFTAWKNAHPEQESGDPGYDARNQQYKDQLEEIDTHFPGATGYSSGQFLIDTKVDPNVMLKLRQVAESEEFVTKTDFGRGLKAYLDFRRGIMAEMSDRNINNLDTVIAERSGLQKKWLDFVDANNEAHPDFAYGYDVFGLDKDLVDVKTAGEKALDALDEDTLNNVVDPWQDKWEKIKAAPYEGNIVSSGQKFAAYARMRDYADTAYAYPAGQNPLKLWWGNLNDDQRKQELVSVGGRDAIYWSRFNWEVMAKKTGDKKLTPTAYTANFWNDVDAARSQAFQDDRSKPNFDLGEQLDRIDKGIVNEANKNPKIKAQLTAMNTWAYGLRSVVLNDTKDVPAVASKGTRKTWEQVFNAASKLQTFLQDEKLTGNLYGDDKTYFNQVKDALTDWLKTKQKDKVFAKEWAYVQDLVGSDLIVDQLMPDSWYPIGVPGDAPAETVPAGVAHVGGKKLRKDPKTGLTLAAAPLASIEKAKQELHLPQLTKVIGGYRTAAEQRAMDPDQNGVTAWGLPAAPVGQSNHEKGLAVDIPVSFLDAHPDLVNWLRNNGWTNLAGDPPHWDYTG
jgi:hypothetical protein